MSSERVSLPREKGQPLPKIELWFEEGAQNLGDKKGLEEPEQELEGLPFGEEEERFSVPCQETTPSLFPKK
jgi:hypothetical protein